MKVGFVVECHRDGADHKVIDHLVRALRGDVEACFTCCGSKRVLFDECNKLVEALFVAEGCERVFVVWDLVPCDEHFQGEEGAPCRAKEREHLLKALRPQDVMRTVMLCITHELEAWLLADGKALEIVLARRTHPIKPIADERRPEDHRNPKQRVMSLFNKHGRGDYVDSVHALKIVEHAKHTKLARAPSFARMKQKLEAL